MGPAATGAHRIYQQPVLLAVLVEARCRSQAGGAGAEDEHANLRAQVAETGGSPMHIIHWPSSRPSEQHIFARAALCARARTLHTFSTAIYLTLRGGSKRRRAVGVCPPPATAPTRLQRPLRWAEAAAPKCACAGQSSRYQPGDAARADSTDTLMCMCAAPGGCLPQHILAGQPLRSPGKAAGRHTLPCSAKWRARGKCHACAQMRLRPVRCATPRMQCHVATGWERHVGAQPHPRRAAAAPPPPSAVHPWRSALTQAAVQCHASSLMLGACKFDRLPSPAQG